MAKRFLSKMLNEPNDFNQLYNKMFSRKWNKEIDSTINHYGQASE